jgi:hypothetical protein
MLHFQLCYCSKKTAIIHNTEINECGCVSIKLYLEILPSGQIWPISETFLIIDLEECPAKVGGKLGI